MTDSHGINSSRFAVAGLGRCGATIASAIARVGFLSAVWNRSEGPTKQWIADHAAGEVECFHGELERSRFVTAANCFVVCVSDQAVPEVVMSIARNLDTMKFNEPRSFAIIHMSGVTGTITLEEQVRNQLQSTTCDISVGSLHPAFSFSGAHQEGELDGCIGAVTASNGTLAEASARRLAQLLKLETCEIEEADRTLWHAACTIAANHLVTLADDAIRAAFAAGVDRRLAVSAMSSLMRSACSRIESADTGAALTGAVSRGDVGTVRQHIDALGRMEDDSLLHRYKEMASATTHLAVKNHRISENTGRLIQHAFD